MATTATQLDIYNMAIRLLGASPLTSTSDDTEEASILNDVYDWVLDEVLSAHPWNFAIKRDELAEKAGSPEFEYESWYDLPADNLRVIRMEDDAEFTIEGGALLTNEGSAKIKYIAQITTTTKFSPHFVTALAARLAAEVAYPLTNSVTLSKAKYKEYELKLKRTKSVDAQEGKMHTVEDISYIDDRE